MRMNWHNVDFLRKYLGAGVLFSSQQWQQRRAKRKTSHVILTEVPTRLYTKNGQIIAGRKENEIVFVHYFAQMPSVLGGDLVFAAVSLFEEDVGQTNLLRRNMVTSDITVVKPLNTESIIYINVLNICRNLVYLGYNGAQFDRQDWIVLVVDDRHNIDIDPLRHPVRHPLTTPSPAPQRVPTSTRNNDVNNNANRRVVYD